jgi:predicted alpha/beta-hydrolase family hydrolase
VRVEQPWRLQGRRIAPAPATLDVAWNAVVPALDDMAPLVLGGRSAGARVACRTAVGLGALGCLALAFPLHPPGRPDRSRLPELTGSGVETLVVQGERDAFGRPEEFPGSVSLRPVPGADHGFAVPARSTPGRAALLASVADDVAAWVLTLAGVR